ncbi:MAG TPA: alpha/beta hydrolase [Sphingomonadaceae bacterium]
MKVNTFQKAGLIVAALCLAGSAAAQQVDIHPDGTTVFPQVDFPPSPLMSKEGNASRVEHILTERSLKGKSTDAVNAALFGPWLARTKAAYDVAIRSDTIGGVHVLVYEPRGGIDAAKRNRVLINLHGGGFVGCFTECGGLESIPIAALTGLRVISVDYREFPQAKFPAASEDVAAVYRQLLASFKPEGIGIFGCSAGGLLTSQSLAWFHAHELPEPGAAGVFCAGGDARFSGDSRIIGMILGDGERPAAVGGSDSGYMGGANLDDPTASPAGDPDTLRSFPPTLIITGSRDFAMSDAIDLDRRLSQLDVDSELHVWDGGRHAFFYDERVPESQEAYRTIARFFLAHLR